jgi:hypothetical protein
VGDAKNIIVKPISSQDANKIIKSLHYSGKVVNNSQLHLGVFYNGRCGGAMQFGPSLDKRKIVGLVKGTLWNEFMELNRLAFADWLPRNGESRSIAYAMRFIKKNYSWMKWIISFADGTQCGDGTIYRASGFVLTAIKENSSIWETPDGVTFTDIGVRTGNKEAQKITRTFSKTTVTKANYIADSGKSSMAKYKAAGCKPKAGFQLRYLYFLDPTARERLTVPILPFSEIERHGAAMYKGIKRVTKATSGDQLEGGGAIPTHALQDKRPKQAMESAQDSQREGSAHPDAPKK